METRLAADPGPHTHTELPDQGTVDALLPDLPQLPANQLVVMLLSAVAALVA